MAVTVLIMGLFIVLGFIFRTGKASFLIAGFNTLPAEEQETYDKPALSRFMGNMMFLLALSMVLWLLSDLYDADWLLYTGIGLFCAIIAGMLVYLNTGNRFKK
ncbi:DUF3784 domain-containing protein [Sporosarcina koreensis]|uniref:DUF3784 domain-containing protein n=1 Tax=Sporosarcina koreensis TaxID=334735 RepID=UPI0009E3B49E|nr:DUF3784 domain-containing protein [Sporosarcina koreensis]